MNEDSIMKKPTETSPYRSSSQNTLLAVLLCLAAICRTNGAGEERQELISVSGESFKIVHSVLRRQILSEKNAWQLGVQPFPADLRALVVKARGFLERTRETRAPLLPFSVSLHWTVVPVDDRRQTFADRCFVVVGFNSTTPEGETIGADELSVVMLLDGTIADGVIASGRLIYPFRRNASTMPDAPIEPK
jgi:hypothetical protein